jgi:DNA-binding MarR family transcriptional regulator
MKSDEFTTEDYQALAEFRYQLRHFTGFSERLARAAGIEPQQHQMLLAIKGFPGGRPVTVSDLAERLSLRHHSAVELVNRGEERGLVRRRRAEDDRRQVYIELTEAGEKVLRELSLHNRIELLSRGPALVDALKRLLEQNRRPGYTGISADNAGEGD